MAQTFEYSHVTVPGPVAEDPDPARPSFEFEIKDNEK